jgi:general secretion pathway protein G
MTLLEIMIVLFIMLSIASMSILAINSTLTNAKKREAGIFVHQLEGPLGSFNLNVGRYPTTDEGLAALISPPGTLPNPDKWEGPYTKNTVTDPDPWGNPYQYRSPSENSQDGYDLWSMGPDGASGTDDDICSWKSTK